MDFYQLGLALAGSTDYAARRVMKWSGKGRKNEADHEAVFAMRDYLDGLKERFIVLIGEGEKDQAPQLFAGERLGLKDGEPEIDLVVDPLECTTNFARGLHDSMSVIMAAPHGKIPPIPGTYMTQFLLPPGPAAEFLSDMPTSEVLDMSTKDLMRLVAEKNGSSPSDFVVVVQDRPRHTELIESLRSLGAGVALIESGSISAGTEILLRKGGRWSMMAGTYGAPEGLVLAFMARISGGYFAGRIAPHDPLFARKTRELGLEDKALAAHEWCPVDGCLVLTGVHSSTFLHGVEMAGGARTESLLWSKEGLHFLNHSDGRLTSAQQIEYLQGSRSR